MNNDVFGLALKAFDAGDASVLITVESDVAETDQWPLAEFFHSWDDMGPIERKALTLANGRTLDVGAGSGCHTLWLQQQNGVEAEALDISQGAVEVMKRRGVRKAIAGDFYNFVPGKKYDTLLFLMNGIGLAGSVDGLDKFLARAASLLAPGGQILVDSSDLIYLYEEEDGSYSLPIGGRYYGEMTYTFVFNGERSEPFDWLYCDPQTLLDAADRNGLAMEIVAEGDHFDFLARLTRK